MTKPDWEEQLRQHPPSGRGWNSQLARGVEQRIDQVERSRDRARTMKWVYGLTAATAAAAVVLAFGGPALDGKFSGTNGQNAPGPAQQDSTQTPTQDPAQEQTQDPATNEEFPLDQRVEQSPLKNAKVVAPILAIEPAGRVQHKRFDSPAVDQVIEEWWDPQTESYRICQDGMNDWELNTIRIGSTMWVWSYNEQGQLANAEKVLLNPGEPWNRGWETLFDPLLEKQGYEKTGETQFAGQTVEQWEYGLDPTLRQRGFRTYTMVDPKTKLPLAHVYIEPDKPMHMDTYQYTYENDYDQIFTPPADITFTEKDLSHVPTPEEITRGNQNMSPDEQTDPTMWPKHSSEDY